MPAGNRRNGRTLMKAEHPGRLDVGPPAKPVWRSARTSVARRQESPAATNDERYAPSTPTKTRRSSCPQPNAAQPTAGFARTAARRTSMLFMKALLLSCPQTALISALASSASPCRRHDRHGANVNHAGLGSDRPPSSCPLTIRAVSARRSEPVTTTGHQDKLKYRSATVTEHWALQSSKPTRTELSTASRRNTVIAPPASGSSQSDRPRSGRYAGNRRISS